MEDGRINAAGNNAVMPNNPMNLPPVAPDQSGQGLPYAPENWPNPGDIWSWKAGLRIQPTGYFKDRYLYPPASICPPANPGSRNRRISFASKLQAQRFLLDRLPDPNVQEFFDSFSWKIPAICPAGNGHARAAEPISAVPPHLLAPEEESESESDLPSDSVECKLGNRRCRSLILQQDQEKYSPVMPCDVCCANPIFCRDCCCLLCHKALDPAYGGYSYFKCPAKVGGDICGHAVHLDCAVYSFLAGTVGGYIDLNAEYLCMRCDRKSDLISHANKLLQTCEAIDADVDTKEKILNLGVSLLGESEKANAKELMSRIELAISKLKGGSGTNTEDIINVVDNLTDPSASGSSNNSNAKESHLGTESSASLSDFSRLELEVEQVLEYLRKSQVNEYNLAEEVLNDHKRYLQNLYEQLASEKSELANQPQSSSSDVLVNDAVRERVEQIRREVKKFEEMKKVAQGFGSTPKHILEEHFGL